MTIDADEIRDNCLDGVYLNDPVRAHGDLNDLLIALERERKAHKVTRGEWDKAVQKVKELEHQIDRDYWGPGWD